jgi:natural product biosynthesis luciferase-like monooxygenase protein
MDQRLGSEPGTWLAVTSLSFDISVLETLWTLTRGFEVIVHAPAAQQPLTPTTATVAPEVAARRLDFSLFYFASDAGEAVADKYRLLLEGAKFADARDFAAVWTPERHFHAFGGLYPSPAVASAALAVATRRIRIRAGSVVMPLHHPIRVAEEWALVDNLSGGRVDVSFASGWQPNDFVLRPETYADRKRVTYEGVDQVRRLWRGEAVPFPGPRGSVSVRTLPRPVQAELPVWITIAGNPETFVDAGRLGFNVLTHLLGQDLDELAHKLELYRGAWREAGHPGQGHVTLMLHTFVGDDDAAVKEAVRGPMKAYLRSAMDLVKAAAWTFPTFKEKASRGMTIEEAMAGGLSEDEVDALLEHAFERYFASGALFGSSETCMRLLRTLKGMRVDEVACLVDFGVATAQALAHLEHLDRLRQRCAAEQAAAAAACGATSSAPEAAPDAIPDLIERFAVSHLQCTPSMATMLLHDDRARAAMRRLRRMLVGGEALPPALARELCGAVGGEVHNMYGPTETTVWSTSGRVDPTRLDRGVSIGRPIANTRVYVLDGRLEPVPEGVVGELFIGGDGVVRGYHGRPELTAQAFLPDPFRGEPGARMYRTGDLAAWTPAGELTFHGRADHQVKIRGYRIELGEIEAKLRAAAGVAEAVVVAREDAPGDKRLAAYLVPAAGHALDAAALRERLRADLPEFMVPAHFVVLERLPLTPNKKVDRRALPPPQSTRSAAAGGSVAASGPLELAIAAVWQDALGLERVGRDDNFFDLGGHSLLAVKVHRDLQKALARSFPITDLFRFPTVRGLAESLAEPGGAGERVQEAQTRGEMRRAAAQQRTQRRAQPRARG